MPRLCYEGIKHTCFGPWYICAIFGCAGDNPRPKEDDDAELKRIREANIAYLTGDKK